MKLIDKSALVAEIERLKSIYTDDENIHYVARYNLLVDILSFLDTIEVKEEPVNKDLEEAAWLYYGKNRLPIPPEWDLHKEFIDFFKAGAKWQKEQTIKWLEENLAKETSVIGNGNVTIKFRGAIEAFKKAMEE